MKKLTISILILLILPGMIRAENFFAGLQTGYFSPSNEVFKEIYGSGFYFSGELGIDTWKRTALFLGLRYFSKKGELSYTKEEATLKIIPIHLGVRLRLSEQKIVPFLGASISLNFFRENVPSQTVLDTKLGFLVETGIFIRISKRYFIKFDFNYNHCQIKPFHTRINIGGINAGFGLKYCF